MLKGKSFVAALKEKSLQGYHLNLQDNIFPCIHKWVSGKADMIGCRYGHGRGHGEFQNTHLHLFLQQYSLPNPGVDLLSIYKYRVKWSKDRPAF